MSDKPNILFFFTDDQRFDTIHSLGNKEIITPNMDVLVENGTAFTQAHIPCGTIDAVCMPSRAMMHTGRTLFHLQQEGQQIPENHITLGEVFKEAGYRTYGSGKWHNGTSSYTRSFTEGADIFFGGYWDHWNVPCCDYDPSGKYENIINITPNFTNSNNVLNMHCHRFSTGKHSTDLICEHAVDYLNRYDSNQPFFMYLSFLAPHDPRTMPKRFMDMYGPDSITLPDNFMPEHPFNYGASAIRDETLAPYPRTQEEIRRHIAEYYAMITHLDDALGRIMETLEKTGQAKNTIIVLAGDNGLAVGQHGLMGKQSHYEHSIRVPLILSGPGIPKSLKLDNYAYLLDVFPTLCDLAGIMTPDSVDGKSLVPMIKNPDVKLRETLYFAYTNLIRGAKDERYKLIEYVGNIRKSQLFDLREDSWELHDLFSDSSYAPVVEKLRKEMFRFRDEWDDRTHPHGQKYWECYEADLRLY